MTLPIKRNTDGTYEVASNTCEFCGDQYIDVAVHRRSPRHQQWLKGELQPEIPVPHQPDPMKYSILPPKLGFGESVVCPRCKGKVRGVRRDKLGGVKPAEDWTRDPSKPSIPCVRCNGFGLVPNQAV